MHYATMQGFMYTRHISLPMQRSLEVFFGFFVVEKREEKKGNFCSLQVFTFLKLIPCLK